MRGIFLSLLLLLLPQGSLAFEVPPNDGFVTDTASLLEVAEEQALEESMGILREEIGHEIAVVTVKSLGGEEASDVATQIGRKWGVGSKQEHTGVILLVSYEDREVFIATGYGSEGAIPDVIAKGIIEEEIFPHFRRGNFSEGILAGVQALEKTLRGEEGIERYAPIGEGAGGYVKGIPVFFLFLFGMLLVSFIVLVLRDFIAHTAPTPSFLAGGAIGGLFGAIFGTLFLSFLISIPLFVILGIVLDYVASILYQASPWMRQWVHAQRRHRRGGGFFMGGFGGGRGGRGGFGGFSGGSFGGGGAGGRW